MQRKQKNVLDGLSKEECLLHGKKRAMCLLERKDYGRKELMERLFRDGYETETVEMIIAYLDGYHYLDDVRVAGSYIRSRKEYKSRRELEYMLKNKGISEEDIETAMEDNYKTEDGSSQEDVAVQRQLRKYHVTEASLEELSYEDRQKLAAKLYRKGFSQDKIRKALQI